MLCLCHIFRGIVLLHYTEVDIICCKVFELVKAELVLLYTSSIFKLF